MKHEVRRLKRLHKIQEIFEKNKIKGPEDEERLISELSMSWGASRRTILEYIKIVKGVK